MENGVEIHQLTPDEWSTWRDMRVSAHESDSTLFGSTLEEDLQTTENEWRARIQSSRFYVARKDGVAVGMVCSVANKKVRSKHITHVYSMYVSPADRGHGIGRKLLERVLSDVESAGATVKLTLSATETNAAAIGLYESVGFKKIALLEKELRLNGQFSNEWVMEKILK